MQVTFTNASGSDLFVSALYKEILAGESVTTSRTPAQLDFDQALKALIEAGDLTLGFTLEPGDAVDIANLDPQLYKWLPVHTDGNRPLPTAVTPGTIIFNSSDNFSNISDGTNWRDPTGAIT